MSKIRKRFQRLLNNQIDVKWNELKTIIEFFGLTVQTPNGGSHFLVYHPDDPDNTMISVPVHSNRVKRFYVKRVIRLIEDTCSEEE